MRHKIKYIIAFILVAVFVLAQTMPAAAKDKRVTYLVTYKSEKNDLKWKFARIFSAKYGKDGRLLKSIGADKEDINTFKLIYGQGGRIRKRVNNKYSFIKYIYLDKGKRVIIGEYSGTQFDVTDKLKFDKKGNLIWWKNYTYDGQPKTIYKYKNEKLVKVLHYDKNNKKVSVDVAKYNKKGWLTEVKTIGYEKNGKQSYSSIEEKTIYTEDEKYVYAKRLSFSVYGGYDYESIKYDKNLKAQPSCKVDPFYFPYMPVTETDSLVDEFDFEEAAKAPLNDGETSKYKYKYIYYKNGAKKGLIKYAKEYLEGYWDKTTFFKYKKVNMSLKRERLQHFLCSYEDLLVPLHRGSNAGYYQDELINED